MGIVLERLLLSRGPQLRQPADWDDDSASDPRGHLGGANKGNGQMHDIVIRGGTIIDGTGSPGYTGDVAIDGAKLAQVGGKAGPG